MYKLPGLLLCFLLLWATGAVAQVGNVPDTIVRDYNNYDTTLPKDNFVDTVHHIAQDTAHHANTDQLKQAREKAEVEKKWIKTQILALTAPKMHGRGYVKGGRDTAARYILKKFHEYKLKPVTAGGPWAQGFSFPVNTFPGRMYVEVNGDSLEAGVDFIVDPASPSFSADNLKVKRIDLNDVADTAAWRQMLQTFDQAHAYVLDNLDSFCARVLDIRKSQFAELLPVGCFIVPENGRLMWGVSRETIKATVLYIDNDIMPKKLKKVSVEVVAQFVARARSENIIACVPGEVKDSFIVFTAHYDHLGMMGDTAFFPGASANASGTAMLLYLANYFGKHPQHYSIMFIAFAGEEAALMGSEFYTTYPFAPLKNIKFLTNIDIMSDATKGVTVVNATKFPEQFELLQQLNTKGKYVPAIAGHGPAANSDHYYFSEAGVPCFSISSDGGKGNYHDVNDRMRELSLNHIDDFAKLMMDFVKEMK